MRAARALVRRGEKTQGPVEMLVVQVRRQVNRLAAIFAAQFAAVLPPQKQRERRRLGEYADQKGRLAGKSRRIDVKKKYRGRADQHVNQRQTFVNRTSKAHG